MIAKLLSVLLAVGMCVTPPATIKNSAYNNASDTVIDTDNLVQYEEWNNSTAILTKNDATGETKVWRTLSDEQKIQLSTDAFYETENYNYGDRLTVNCLKEYKGRLYAGCDNGYVIIFTECIKCHKLKKPVNIDIKEMDIKDGVMTVGDGEEETTINMAELGSDSIEPDEANQLISNGAVIVDVRGAEEFEEDHVEGSVNIPLDKISDLEEKFSPDTVIIFCCQSGVRSVTAVTKAYEMGFEKTYSAGNYLNLK